MRTLRRMLAGLWLALGFIGGFSLFSAIFDRDPPIDYIAASAESATVDQGGDIDIHFDVFRRRICPVVKVSRVLTDSQGTERAIANYTLSTTTRPGRESYDRTITIPDGSTVGPADYQIRISYACNFLHRLGWPVVVTSPRVHFKITAAPPDAILLPAIPPLTPQHD